MKIIKIFYSIGIVIIICGISLMLTSMAFRNDHDIGQSYLNIGFLIGAIGTIILVITNGFDKSETKTTKPKPKSDDEIKRGN